MKTLPLVGVISMLAASLAVQAQTTVFNDTFGSGGSTLNGTSTPGGTPTASFTSYDVASTKTGSCAITAGSPGFLREKLSSGTTAGYLELQALFTSTPFQLVNVGDSINLTITFTNSANTLLEGGSGSVIDVGLFNSGGSAPVAGSLNGAGLSGAITYASGNCQNWQGYVASINTNGSVSKIYNRPQQTGTTSANQDLVFSGAGTGLYNFPAGTQIGSSVTLGPTPASGAKYTMSFTILLSAAGTVSITNNLYDANGNLLSNLGGTTGAANTYTNYANKYDGLSIGLGNKGTSLNPTMDISRITVTTNYYYSPTITGLNNQTVIAGNNATLSPAVTGNPQPVFQWYVSTDGGVTSNSLSYATASSLTLTNVQYSQNNNIYTLVAANVMGTNVSSMTLTVIVTPNISGLVNQAVYPGGTVNINPSVSGVPAPTLQWLTNGVPVTDGLDANGSTITGSTTGSLSIADAQVADTATYSLVASNSAGIVTNSMYLLVSASDVLPTLVGPTNITVIQGNDGTFSASAYYGLPQPTLQWLDQTGTPIVDATNASLTIPDVQYSQNGYVYSLIASNSVGSVTNSATLTVIVSPAIISQPSNLTVTNTQSASFAVAATGVPNPTYQWYKNGSSISSALNSTATNATLVLASTSPSDAGSTYYAQISNAAGTTNSATATLTVNSTIAATAFSPANSGIGLCYDTPLTVTFGSTVSLGTNGLLRIYNVTNSATPVDSIDVSLGAVQQRTFPGDGQSFSYQTITVNGSTATIYPHFNVLSSNATYYVTIDNGAFKDSAGANFVGIAATNAWQFSTKAGGPADPNNPVVKADGSADFLTVQGAVNSIAAGTNATQRVINIRNGIYNEIVDVAGKHNVTFRGQSRSGVIIAFPNNSTFQAANGGTTHARMTFKVNANNVVLDTLTVSNSTPQGGSQAEALMIESSAQRCIVYNSELDSRQDTILANVNSSQAYFYKCIVKGNFDFIWGGGNLYFDQCLIDTIGGASGFNLTAARTDTSATTSANFPWLNPGGTYTANGMSFVNCTITADSGVSTVTLAGSNGSAGNNVSWYGCDFATNYIAPTNTLFGGNFIFWQDLNTSNGIPVTYPVVTSISGTDARLLAATNIPTWFYGWQPQLAPNILTNPMGQSISGGGTATFTVAATGIPAPTYQWLKNGTPISGQTGSSLTISNASANDATSYSVIVSNSVNVVTSSSASLTVANTAPALTPVSDQTVNVGANVSIANIATDPDVPAQTLSFTLPVAPSGAAVDSGSGSFTWRPTVSAAGTTNPVQVVVTDNGTPNLSATNSFNVIVNPLTQPTMSSSAYSGGQFNVSISGQIGPDYELQGTTNLAGGTWTSIATTNSPASSPFILTDPNAAAQPVQFYRIVTGPPLP